MLEEIKGTGLCGELETFEDFGYYPEIGAIFKGSSVKYKRFTFWRDDPGSCAGE